MNNIEKGTKGENIAEEYLHSLGFKTLCKNYRFAKSEIDLIMQDGSTIVFIEVKSRNTNRFGSGLEAITARKQAMIISGATAFCSKNALFESSIRFDAIEVDLTTCTVSRYVKAAFMPKSQFI